MEGYIMTEMYHKSIKVNAPIAEAEKACKIVCNNAKMVIKDSYSSDTAFFISAAEKISWVSTSWPVKFDIKASYHNDNLIIDISSSSPLGSLTQGRANMQKLDGFVESLQVYLG